MCRKFTLKNLHLKWALVSLSSLSLKVLLKNIAGYCTLDINLLLVPEYQEFLLSRPLRYCRSRSLSICLQTYHSSQTRCLRTYHMFASQPVNPPWHPCKSVPQQASNFQFPLQAHWHIGMMQRHLRVVPVLARQGRWVSFLPSLFLGVGLGNFCW
jgi:hypothetical protein